MFTPQEVREHSESFEKAVFGGYSMSSVDDFIAQLSEDYAALYKENAVLKSKMKVLVEQMDKYHSEEESLQKAIMVAQKTADEMVVDAERKCAKMMSDTEQSLRQRNQDLKKELAAEAERVARAKKAAAAFVEQIENQVHQSLSQLERIRQMTISAKSGKKTDEGAKGTLQELKISEPEEVGREIGENLGRILAQETKAPEESVPAEKRKEPVTSEIESTRVIPTAE